MKLSIATEGRIVSTWREEYGSHIFGKICVTAIAILKLFPKSAFSLAKNNMELWDISSVCILTRSLIDTYNVFYYLILEQVNNDELEFRFLLSNLHSECERLEMLQLLKSTNPKLDEIKQHVENLKNELKNNKFYQKLDPKNQKKYSSGEIGIFLTNSQISQIAKFNAKDAESLKLFEPVVGYCTGYLSLSIRDFVKMVPDQSRILSAEIIKTIEDWEYIMKFI